MGDEKKDEVLDDVSGGPFPTALNAEDPLEDADGGQDQGKLLDDPLEDAEGGELQTKEELGM